MSTNNGNQDLSNDLRSTIDKILNQLETDCLYSMKGHYNSSSIWTKVHWYLSIPIIVFSALLTLFANQNWTIAGMIVGILTTILSSINAFLKTDKRAQNHFLAAGRYSSLKDRLKWYRNTNILYDREESIVQKGEDFLKEKEELNSTSPQILRRAYEKCKKGIEDGEANYEQTNTERSL